MTFFLNIVLIINQRDRPIEILDSVRDSSHEQMIYQAQIDIGESDHYLSTNNKTKHV